MVIERVQSSTAGYRVRLSCAATTDSISGRVFVVYDFSSAVDRERFIGVMNHMAIVPENMPRCGTVPAGVSVLFESVL